MKKPNYKNTTILVAGLINNYFTQSIPCGKQILSNLNYLKQTNLLLFLQLFKHADFVFIILLITILIQSCIILFLFSIFKKNYKYVLSFNQKEKFLFDQERMLTLKINEITAQLNTERIEKDKIKSELADTTAALNMLQALSKETEIKIKLTHETVKTPHVSAANPEGLWEKLQHPNKSPMAPDDWKKLEKAINQVDCNFTPLLKKTYPTLNKTDLQLIYLIKMDRDITEMSHLLDTSTRNVSNRRYRLRKRLGLNGNEDLNDFIRYLQG